MRRMPLQNNTDPISKLNGLLITIYNAPHPNEMDVRNAYLEIGECLVYLKNEIEEIKKSKGNQQ